MRGELTRHHLLWPRTAYQTRLQKRARVLYIVEAPEANHRLLHASLDPPELPSQATLGRLVNFAMDGQRLGAVIDRIGAPLGDHIQQQLGILALPQELAMERLMARDWVT